MIKYTSYPETHTKLLSQYLIMKKSIRKSESTLNVKANTINLSNMQINLWYSPELQQWRWTLTQDREQISGQQPILRDAMNDVANSVEYLLDTQQAE